MNRSIESVLYIDIQARPPAAHCEICGSELYLPGKTCLRCQRP